MKRTRLNQVSKAKAKWTPRYQKAKRARLEWMIEQRGFVYCERCDASPGDIHCRRALEPHHPDGRNGALILHFFYVCHACHAWIHETNPNAARQEGWLRPKNAPPNHKTMPKLTITETTTTRTIVIEPAHCDTRTAKDLDRQVKEYGEKFGATLLEIREKRAWRALTNQATGQLFESFRQYCDIELVGVVGTRSTVYLALAQERVSLNVGEPVPVMQADAIKALPAPEQKEVLAEAKQTARAIGVEVTTEIVKETVERRQTPAVPKINGSNGAKKVVTINVPSEADLNKSEGFLVIVAKACGADVRKAIEEHAIRLSMAELKQLAGLEGRPMKEVSNLLRVGWTVKRAIGLVSSMLTEQSTLGDVLNLAIAAGGAWEGTFKGAEISVKMPKVR